MTENVVDVRHAEGARRYEVLLDGVLAGFTEYLDHGDQRIFFHTEVAPEFGGHGLGTAVVAGALADTEQAGKRIVPVCPMVAAYVQRHHEYDAAIDQPTEATIDYLRSQLG